MFSVTSGDSCSVVTSCAGENRRVSGVANVGQTSARVTCFLNRADRSSDRASSHDDAGENDSDRAGSRDDVSVLFGDGFSSGAPMGDAL